MKLIPVLATCLSPLQYHSIQITRGTKTASFIGDLALTYALGSSMGLLDDKRILRDRADYSELKKLPLLATVLFPERIEYLPTLLRNTLMAIDTLGTNEDPTSPIPTGSSMYSNFYSTQAIKPGSTFKGYILMKHDVKWDLPPTIRIGNNRCCLLSLQQISQESVGNGWINLYALQYIVGMKKIIFKEEMELYEVMHQYRIVKGVPPSTIVEWYEPWEKADEKQ